MGKMRAKVISGTRDGYQCLRPGASQRLAFTATSAQLTALGGSTNMVRVFATQDCWLAFGANPTAVANDGSSVFVPGGVVQFFLAEPSEKIAAIRDANNGDLHVMEGAAA